MNVLTAIYRAPFLPPSLRSLPFSFPLISDCADNLSCLSSCVYFPPQSPPLPSHSKRPYGWPFLFIFLPSFYMDFRFRSRPSHQIALAAALCFLSSLPFSTPGETDPAPFFSLLSPPSCRHPCGIFLLVTFFNFSFRLRQEKTSQVPLPLFALIYCSPH